MSQTHIQGGVGENEAWMLNLRFFLILLVFIASGIEPLIGRFHTLNALYAWIFTFHIPLFAFVTGYFAKTNLLGRKGFGVLRSIFVQYVIFQSLYSLVDVIFFHAFETGHSFMVPYLMLWFLVAHIGWRMLLWLMVALRLSKMAIFLVSLTAGITAGYFGDDGSWMSISRMFVFLPFFAAGFTMDACRWRQFYESWARRALGIFSLLLLPAAYTVLSNGIPDWLYGRFTYAEMGVSGWEAALTRGGYYVLQGIAGAAFLAWIPRKVSVLTDWGSRTLYVFLLHGLFVRSWIRFDLYDSIRTGSDALLLLMAIFILTILLTLPQIRRMTRWLIEPNLSRFDRQRHRV